VIGTALAGRNRAELEPLIGYFVNTVAMRVNVLGDQPFVSLLREVKSAAIAAQDYPDIPFERVVEVMHPERGSGSAPFSQVLFILQSATSAPPSFHGLQWSRMTIHNGTSKGDLMLSISEESDGLRCGLEYDADLFTRESAERLLESFRLALESAVCS
jgi:non-ribosomal peptide synthetase component F